MYEIGDETDLVGLEELIGYDGDDDDYYDDEDDDLAALLGAQRSPWSRRGKVRGGARRRQTGLTRRAIAVAKAVKKVEQGTLLSKTPPTKSREFPIGFDSVANIAAAATATLTQRPQIVFRPERIVVPAAVAAFFQITDVKVGKNSQFVSSGAVPAATFAETAFGVRLKMDTCQISQDLIIDVTNIDIAAHRFMASMIGESVE
jgi:hypothetical protein